MPVRTERLSDTITLYCGDSAEILPTLSFFDACVTDPPYGIDVAARSKVGGGRQIWRQERHGQTV